MANNGRTAEQAVSIYVTFPDLAIAERIGEALVAEGLAACANLVPGMRSIYRWKGKVEGSEEVLGFIKTTAGRAAEVIARIKSAHPYDTPAIVVLPIETGSGRYLDWIRSETRGKD